MMQISQIGIDVKRMPSLLRGFAASREPSFVFLTRSCEAAKGRS